MGKGKRLKEERRRQAIEQKDKGNSFINKVLPDAPHGPMNFETAMNVVNAVDDAKIKKATQNEEMPITMVDPVTQAQELLDEILEVRPKHPFACDLLALKIQLRLQFPHFTEQAIDERIAEKCNVKLEDIAVVEHDGMMRVMENIARKGGYQSHAIKSVVVGGDKQVKRVVSPDELQQEREAVEV